MLTIVPVTPLVRLAAAAASILAISPAVNGPVGGDRGAADVLVAAVVVVGRVVVLVAAAEVGGTDVDDVATAVDEVAVSADVDAPLPVSLSPQPVAASVIINATASTTA